jgi:hypothetical protein
MVRYCGSAEDVCGTVYGCLDRLPRVWNEAAGKKAATSLLDSIIEEWRVRRVRRLGLGLVLGVVAENMSVLCIVYMAHG